MAKKKRFHRSRGEDSFRSGYYEDRGKGTNDAYTNESRRENDQSRANDQRKHAYPEDYLGREEYAGVKMRTMTETRDFHMIQEDHNAVANMPQNVIMKSYPKAYHGAYEDLNDTITGVDHQMREDSMRQKKGPYPEMY